MQNYRALYPSAKHIIAHQQIWFGDPSHTAFLYPLAGKMIPYNSGNPDIIADQCAKLVAAGVTDVELDYYGTKGGTMPVPSAQETICQLIYQACKTFGLGFTLCIDNGAFGGSADMTDQYIAIVNYVIGEYVNQPGSPWIMDAAGKPTFSYFGEQPNLDWARFTASLVRAITNLFEMNQWGHLFGGGCFYWPQPVKKTVTLADGTSLSYPDAGNINLASVQNFCAQAAAAITANPALIAVYPSYTAFDDSLAKLISPKWGQDRYITRLGGRTPLLVAKQVPSTALWVKFPFNDHEEGSAAEEGVIVAA